MDDGQQTVGVRELRQNLSIYLRRVVAGAVLQVTERGRPVALLTPLPARMTLRDRLIAEGKLIPGKRGLRELPPPLDIQVAMSGKEALDIERSERLP